MLVGAGQHSERLAMCEIMECISIYIDITRETKSYAQTLCVSVKERMCD